MVPPTELPLKSKDEFLTHMAAKAKVPQFQVKQNLNPTSLQLLSSPLDQSRPDFVQHLNHFPQQESQPGSLLLPGQAKQPTIVFWPC